MKNEILEKLAKIKQRTFTTERRMISRLNDPETKKLADASKAFLDRVGFPKDFLKNR